MSLANSEWNGSLYQLSTLIVDWRPLSSSLDFVFFSFFANLAREPYSRLNSYLFVLFFRYIVPPTAARTFPTPVQSYLCKGPPLHSTALSFCLEEEQLS
eukprot:scaffold6674_cov74-Attheya_sp.AAC.3